MTVREYIAELSKLDQGAIVLSRNDEDSWTYYYLADAPEVQAVKNKDVCGGIIKELPETFQALVL